MSNAIKIERLRCTRAVSIFISIAIALLFGVASDQVAYAATSSDDKPQIERIDCSPVIVPAGSAMGRSVTKFDLAARIYPTNATYDLFIEEELSFLYLKSTPQVSNTSHITDTGIGNYSFELCASEYKKKQDNKIIINDRISGRSFTIPVVVEAPRLVGPDTFSLYEYETIDLSSLYHFDPATYVGENGTELEYPLSADIAIEEGGAARVKDSILLEAKDGRYKRSSRVRLYCDKGAAYGSTQDTERFVTVTLKSPTTTLLWKGQNKVVLRTGDYVDLRSYLQATISPKFNNSQTAKYECISSNPGAVEVSGTSDDIDISAVHEGASLITVKARNGNSISFTVQVKPALAKTSLPKVQERAFDNKIIIEEINTYEYLGASLGGVSQIQIWRATKQNGKYKLIKTLGSNKIGYDPAYEDKKLKPNTAYYYKVRARCAGEKTWGSFSKPVKYWTAPKHKVAGKRTSGRMVTWKKTKGAKGYIVTDSYVKKLGYNVFWQKVMWGSDVTKTTTKTKWKLRKAGGWVDSIIPYAKHGKYYYAHGKAVVKNLSKYKEKDEHRYVSG